MSGDLYEPLSGARICHGQTRGDRKSSPVLQAFHDLAVFVSIRNPNHSVQIYAQYWLESNVITDA